jgi:hypothetical protein
MIEAFLVELGSYYYRDFHLSIKIHGKGEEQAF